MKRRAILQTVINAVSPRIGSIIDSVAGEKLSAEDRAEIQKQISQLAHERQMRSIEASVSLADIDMKDRASAREMAKATRDWFPKVYAVGILVSVVGLTVFDQVHVSMNSGLQVDHIIMTLIGLLGLVAKFYFGGDANTERISRIEKIQNGQ